MKIKQFEEFTIKLIPLNNHVQKIVKQDILLIVIDLFEFQKGCNNDLKRYIDQIIRYCTPTLKMYFVYKEYLRKKQNETHYTSNNFRGKSSFSQQKIQSQLQNLNSQGKIKAENDIEEIQKKFINIPIQQLMESYLKVEQQKIGQIIEICRICSRKVKLQDLQKHIFFCKRKNQLKQQLNNISTKLQNVLLSIKQKQISLQFNQQVKREQDCQLLRVLKIISTLTTRFIGQRRSSLASMKKNVQVTNQLKHAISQFKDKFGCNELLFDFQVITTQKELIKKNIQTLEANYLTALAKNDESSSSFKIFNNRQTKKRILYPKSTFALKNNDLDSQSNSLSSGSEYDLQQKQQKSKTQNIIDQTADLSNIGIQEQQIPLQKCKLNRYATVQLEDNSLISDTQNCQKKIRSQKLIQISDRTEQNENKICLKKFAIIDLLGKGAFGRVYVARRLQTKDIYALKVVKINEQSDKDINSLKNEHQTFKKIQSDHLVRALFSFKQGKGHFFVMQYMPGGDLAKLLADQVYLEEQTAKFYLAQIILAIQHLHNYGIIHRDLKPQNIVLDKDGHLKLTDFGLSQIMINGKIQKVKSNQKKEQKKNRTIKSRRTALINNKGSRKLIGTPDYIAPQIINKVSTDNKTIDWWSLGVIAYELMIGVRPFCAYTIQQVIDNIINFKIQWPQIGKQQGMISYEAYDLIIKLLNKNFIDRLGFKGSQQIKNHVFFKGVDWNNIRQMKSPIEIKIINQQLKTKPQNRQYRQQIENIIESNPQKNIIKSNQYQLEDFVRFDLLGNETFESAKKNINNKSIILEKIRSIATCLNEDNKSILSETNSKSSSINNKISLNQICSNIDQQTKQ